MRLMDMSQYPHFFYTVVLFTVVAIVALSYHCASSNLIALDYTHTVCLFITQPDKGRIP